MSPYRAAGYVRRYIFVSLNREKEIERRAKESSRQNMPFLYIAIIIDKNYILGGINNGPYNPNRILWPVLVDTAFTA